MDEELEISLAYTLIDFSPSSTDERLSDKIENTQ